MSFHEKRSDDASSTNGTKTGVVHAGVEKIEATNKLFGKYSRWFLFVGLGLSAYIYSLDGSTTWQYLPFATSSYEKHSLISAVQTAQGIIIACGKPVTAKFADVFSRVTTYFLVISCYVLGYIMIASSHNAGTVAGGIVFYAIGYSGLQILTQIIIADITTLKWRGLVSALISAPFIINGFVGAQVATGVLSGAGWRWGYGMFAILVPATVAPLVVTLAWAEHKANHRRASPTSSAAPPVSFLTRFTNFATAFDLLGLILLAAGLSLFLLPLTLAAGAKGKWHNPSMIAMLAIGLVLLVVFIIYDVTLAKDPVIAPRFLRNRAVSVASVIGFFDFFSFYLTFSYLSSYVYVVKASWSLRDWSYFNNTQSVALTVFGIMAGVIMRYTHRFKTMLIVGLFIRLFGVGLMIHSRGAQGSTGELVMTQIIQGIGGGIASITLQTGAQASVSHVDVARVTACVLLWTEVGGSVGSAVAGAIWQNIMPQKLAHHLPQLNETALATLYGSISSVSLYPEGDPIREGTIAAYSEVMRIMLILATCLAVVPVLLSFLVPDWHLGDEQNAVDKTDLAGHKEVDAA